MRVTRATSSVKSVVRRAGSGAQRRRLDAHRGLAAAVAAGDELVDEAAVVGDVGEVAAAAQDQRLVERGLEVAVVGLHRAVLVRLAGIVAAGEHAVVAAQRLVALRDVLAASAARLRNAADRLSVRCSRGTPPRPHRAFCSFSASAVKLSPPRTTPTCSQPL